jgi:hypothetical protein
MTRPFFLAHGHMVHASFHQFRFTSSSTHRLVGVVLRPRAHQSHYANAITTIILGMFDSVVSCENVVVWLKQL